MFCFFFAAELFNKHHSAISLVTLISLRIQVCVTRPSCERVRSGDETTLGPKTTKGSVLNVEVAINTHYMTIT